MSTTIEDRMTQVIDESAFKDGEQVVTVKAKLYFPGILRSQKFQEIQAKVEQTKGYDAKLSNLEIDDASNTSSCELLAKFTLSNDFKSMASDTIQELGIAARANKAVISDISVESVFENNSSASVDYSR